MISPKDKDEIRRLLALSLASTYTVGEAADTELLSYLLTLAGKFTKEASRIQAYMEAKESQKEKP